jgi:hypothetical protein
MEGEEGGCSGGASSTPTHLLKPRKGMVTDSEGGAGVGAETGAAAAAAGAEAGGAAAAGALFGAACPPSLNLMTSSLRMRPSLPDPGTREMSTPSSRASERTAGVVSTLRSGAASIDGAADAAAGAEAVDEAEQEVEEAGRVVAGETGEAAWGASAAVAAASSISMSTSVAPTLTMSPFAWCSLTILPLYRLVMSRVACERGQGRGRGEVREGGSRSARQRWLLAPLVPSPCRSALRTAGRIPR